MIPKNGLFKKSAWVVFYLIFCVPLAHAAEGCVINGFTGKIQVLREGVWMDLKEKEVLKTNDHLSTEADATLDMSMNDLAGIRILPRTEVEITGWKSDNMLLNLVKGNLIVNLKKLPADSNFHVETPTALATVRGTQFWGRLEENGETPVTTFAVRQGLVDVMYKVNFGRIYSLSPGQAVDLPKTVSEIKATMRKALPEELKAMEQADAIPTEAV